MKTLMTTLFALALSSGAFAAGMYGGLEENEDLYGHVIFDLNKATSPSSMERSMQTTFVPPGIGVDTAGGVLDINQWPETMRASQRGGADSYGSILFEVNRDLNPY